MSEKNGTRRKVGYVKYGLRRKTQSHQHRKELKNFSNQLRRRLFHLTVSYLQRKLYSMLAYIWHRLCTFVSSNFFFLLCAWFCKTIKCRWEKSKESKGWRASFDISDRIIHLSGSNSTFIEWQQFVYSFNSRIVEWDHIWHCDTKWDLNRMQCKYVLAWIKSSVR